MWNVPGSNEMWSHNFGKGQAVLDFKTEGLCQGVEWGGNALKGSPCVE